MSNKNHKAAKLPASTLRYPMRLDQALLARKIVYSRSKGEEAVRDGRIKVNGVTVTKASTMVRDDDEIKSSVSEEYVSRAGMKLASVAKQLKLNFENKVVLDVGSSTGGFTEYALKHGAKKVIAVDVGTDQLHPKLHGDSRIELHEKTDIRDVVTSFESRVSSQEKTLIAVPDIVLIDVSFISLRYILPHISTLVTRNSLLIAMVKPQFEAGKEQTNKGVIKNDTMRRQILKDFETWAQKLFIIENKADSSVAGAKGNLERFYLLRKV